MDLVALTSRLTFLRFPVGHVYLWAEPEGLTLVDSGLPGSAPAIADAIRELGHRPEDVRRLVLTHFHEDHVGSAAEIAGWGEVEVVAHRDDVPYIQREQAGPPPDLLDWERPLYEQVTAGLPADPPAPVRVDRPVGDGDVLDFGGGAHVVGAAGHTPGSLGLFLSGSGVLFTGDAVARTPDGEVILGVFNADRAGAAASFARLAAVNAEIACFGHGEPLTEGAADRLRAAANRPDPVDAG
jgi:glyoxylase-like metal-dependent hydrolase (beta-lactamase superfamily II)